jgi:CRISPR-associated protein Csd1
MEDGVILASLRDLALREGLVPEPAFESKGVAWIIDIDHEGRFLTLVSTLDDPVADSNGRKPRPQPKMMSIPRRCIRSGGKFEADFLVDNFEYVFGRLHPTSGAPKDKDKPEKCGRSFKLLVAAASEETKLPLLKAVSAFLQSEDQCSKCIAELETYKSVSNDLFTFSCNSELLHLDATAREWWAARATPGEESADTLRQCLVCGKRQIPVNNHDPLKVPGAISKGVPLVCFDKEAFAKYGLSGNENAPICRPCMTAYVEGLRRCLNERYPNPKNPNGPMLGQQAVRLSPDTTAVFWTDTDWSMAGQFALILNRPADLKAALLSPQKGQRPGELEGNFYLMILSGAQGRAMLRSVHRGKVGEIEASIQDYFNTLELEGCDHDRPLSLFALLKSLEPSKQKSSRLPPKLCEEIFLAAVLRRPVPYMVLSAAVNRNRAEQQVTSARAALLQLYFARKKSEAFAMPLDPNCPLPAYRLGRLFAVLEKLQYSAQGKLNTTVVNRFYGAASSRPGTVFPQLMKLAQNHVKKSKAGGFYQGCIGDIVSELGVSFPAMLSLEEQGQFALGFYQQKYAPSAQVETKTETDDDSDMEQGDSE